MPQPGIKAKIDLGELERLCALQPTYDEIAAFFGVSARTIIRHMKEKSLPKPWSAAKRGDASACDAHS
jgi:hypothetical protein